MKILLVAPSESHIYGNFKPPGYPPLGLSYLGAILEEAGHIVKILDIDADKIKDGDFARCLKAGSYGLVGITTTTPTLNKSVHLTELAKKYSNAYTVLGGVHVSVRPEETMKFPSVDFVVVGEGERTIIELVSCIENNLNPESVDGVCYRENGRILKTKPRELISNLDEIPFPARHLYKNQNYSYPDTLASPTFPIFTSRGCPSMCTYCASKCVFKGKFRARSPKNIVDEIEFLVKRFKAKEIHIWDDNFIFLKPRVLETKEEIKKRNIRVKLAFPNGMRVDCVDKDILKALKDMGTYSIAFGVESGNQETLDRIKKGVKLKRIEETFKLTKKFGIETWAFFIIGLPGENESRIKDTIGFALKINPDVAKFHVLKPYPGTVCYEEFVSKGQITDYNFDNYSIHMPPVHRLEDLREEEISYWQKYAYKKFYLRPSIFLKHIKRLKSFHRLKLNLITARSILKIVSQ